MKKYKFQLKMLNMATAYDIRVVSRILNHPKIGRNNVLYYLRELGLLNMNNFSGEQYKHLYLFGKIKVVKATGYSTIKVVISDAGLEYIESNGIYDKIRELSRLYVEKENNLRKKHTSILILNK